MSVKHTDWSHHDVRQKEEEGSQSLSKDSCVKYCQKTFSSFGGFCATQLPTPNSWVVVLCTTHECPVWLCSDINMRRRFTVFDREQVL